MKILYFPHYLLNIFSNYYVNLNYLTKYKIFGKFLKFRNFKYPLNGEYLYFGEMCNVIGNENFYIVDGIDDIYFKNKSKNFKDFATIDSYPDFFGNEYPQFIKFRDINNIIKQVDLIICSVFCNKKYLNFIKGIKNKIPIMMIDKKDHPEVYHDNRNILRGFNKHYFDIFLKQDLPIQNNDDFIFPFCPLPTRKVKFRINSDKKFNFSFVGKFWEKERNDRNEIAELLLKNFNNCNIIDTFKKKIYLTSEELSNILNSTKINISPQGIVWDSYRHTNLAHYGSPILIPSKDCKTVGPNFIDMHNCIMYEVKNVNNKFHIVDTEKLVKKLKSLLSDEEQMQNIYSNYCKTINTGHLKIHRSKYIIDLGKKLIEGKLKI